MQAIMKCAFTTEIRVEAVMLVIGQGLCQSEDARNSTFLPNAAQLGEVIQSRQAEQAE